MVVFLERDEHALRIVDFVFVSRKLCIDLNVKDSVVVGVELVENNWITLGDLVHRWSIPALKLGNMR